MKEDNGPIIALIVFVILTAVFGVMGWMRYLGKKMVPPPRRSNSPPTTTSSARSRAMSCASCGFALPVNTAIMGPSIYAPLP